MGAWQNIYLHLLPSFLSRSLKFDPVLPLPFAPIVFATCVFVTATIVWEFYRGAKARHDLTGESYFAGLINLTLRNRRRYGGYIVHFAIALFFAGVTGSMMYKKEVRKDLQPGDTLRIAGYELKLDKVAIERVPGWKESLLAHVDVFHKGRKLLTLKPRQDTFEGFEGEMQQTPIPAILYTSKHDLYLVLRQVAHPNNLESTSIHLQVLFFPMLVWVWVSGVIFLIGNFVCMLPGGKELRAPERVTARGWVMER
jgi:cytochrome c-type biogenesis protein CcmF